MGGAYLEDVARVNNRGLSVERNLWRERETFHQRGSHFNYNMTTHANLYILIFDFTPLSSEIYA